MTESRARRSWIALITFVALRPQRSGLAFLANIPLFSLNFFGTAGQRECSQQGGDSHRQRACEDLRGS